MQTGEKSLPHNRSIFHSMVLWMNFCVDHTGADESRQEKATVSTMRKKQPWVNCPVSHGQAVHQLLAFLAIISGRLPANSISFLFSTRLGLADSHPACLMKGRDSLVRCGQGFPQVCFQKLFHLLIKNADDLCGCSPIQQLSSLPCCIFQRPELPHLF